ncbi:MAG: tetratricopeptide repeat protein, partial [Acidobacteriota bacterium]
RERYYIVGHYYMAIGDIEKEKETWESASKAYPNDSAAFDNLARYYNEYYGQFEKAIPMANDSLRVEPAQPFGYSIAATAYMALNRLEEARSISQRAVDAKADNLFIHQLLYDLAFLNGDADGMQRQLKWSEGKPSEYYLLNEAANAAASRGQLQKAGELMQRSVQVSERLDFKGTTAATLAGEALTQAEFGNFAKVREMATLSSGLARNRSNLVPVAVALAMTGDVSRAQAITEELDHRFPADTLLHQASIPCVRALIELKHNAPEQAIQALEATTPYELGIDQGFYPIYIRGQAYLRAKRGAEAAAEFQKIVDHRGINPTFAEHSLARLGLGRAYVMTGDTAKARAVYQDFLALWKDADPDIPILTEAQAEYAKLK